MLIIWACCNAVSHVYDIVQQADLNMEMGHDVIKRVIAQHDAIQWVMIYYMGKHFLKS